MHGCFLSTCALFLPLCASSAPNLDSNLLSQTVPLNLTTQDNPWSFNCHRTLQDYPGCIVSDRGSLPTVRTDIDWVIYYVRVLFPPNIQLLPKARLYHGAVLVTAVGTGECFLLGYFVYEMSLNVAVPIPTKDGFKWENQGAMSWFPQWIRSPFDYFDSVWPLGKVSGAVVNKWLDDVPRWMAANTGYRLTSLWSDPDVAKAKQYVDDATCHSFCEYSFTKLYTVGAKFTSQFPLCRNYIPFITKDAVIVNISTPSVHSEATDWYVTMTSCFFSWVATGKTCEDQLAKQKHAFGTDVNVQYHEGDLKAPYFAGFASDHHLEQRMLLPWQNWANDSYVGECVFPESQTSLSRDMNKKIARGLTGVYSGGSGVLVRSPFDGLTQAFRVTPATLWTNDLFMPSQLYPGSGPANGNDPKCPHGKTDGWMKDMDICNEGPWEYAQVGVLVGYNVGKFFTDFDRVQDADWKFGVFYAYDANSVDKRCRWLASDSAWDCPGFWLTPDGKSYPNPEKQGAGSYPAGNPLTDPHGSEGGSGGGAGCHFESTEGKIDQTDAYDGFGRNLVMNKHCQCNSGTYGKDWDQWIDNWLLHAKHKPGFDYQGWFKNGKAPSWGGDIAGCWHDNPRDMINLQNALWWRRNEWSNQQAPLSQWQVDNPASNRIYWGWNEVPVDRPMMNDANNWDAIVIKLPASLGNKIGSNDDSVADLKASAHLALEKELARYIDSGYLVLGKSQYSSKPGSSILFVRETMDFNGNFQKEFFCQWWHSPSKLYDIMFVSDMGPTSKYDTSACYIQAYAGAVAYV